MSVARLPELPTDTRHIGMADTYGRVRGYPVGAVRNLLLTALPPASLEMLSAHAQQVTLPRGWVVARADRPIEAVFFPETGVFAEIVHLADGTAVEVNLAGYEGMTGLAVHLGSRQSPLEVSTVVAGRFLRVAADVFVGLAEHDRWLTARLQLYAQAVLTVRACSIGCDRLHPLHARLARWLLKLHDRVSGDELPVTHDVLALMLGATRPSVTMGALALQHAGFIDYHRGRIRMLNRPGLESVTCECYWTVRRELDRLLNGAGG